MKLISIVMLAFVLQPPTPEQVREKLNLLIVELQQLVNQLPAEPPATLVRSGGDFQAALNIGGVIELEAGATFTAPRFTVWKSGTVLRGNGASLAATSGPALHIPPGVNDVSVSKLSGTSPYSAVFLCGDNAAATQSTVDLMPKRITFTEVTVPTHRGKRAFELNCAATLTNSKALDVWATSLVDSQGIAILNSCGPVTVTGGEYVAASENILIGGDAIKMPCTPTDLTFDNVTLSKPDSWRTDGVSRNVKNLFEVKAGLRVKLLNSTLTRSWRAGQDGWAIVITPKNNQFIQDVIIENVTVSEVGGGVQLLGKDYNTVTPQATSGVVIRNSRFSISKAIYGGRGILALMTGGVLDVTWENVFATFDGNMIVQADSLVPQGPFVMRNSKSTVGLYGVVANGANWGNVGTAGRELATTFENNTLADAPSRFKTNFPTNTWVTRAVLERMR